MYALQFEKGVSTPPYGHTWYYHYQGVGEQGQKKIKSKQNFKKDKTKPEKKKNQDAYMKKIFPVVTLVTIQKHSQ